MALFRELCSANDIKTVRATITADVTKGEPAIEENLYGFWLDDVTYVDGATGEGSNQGVLVYEGRIVQATAEAATYAAGDYVYDDPTTPTGVLNLTSTDRRRIGIVLKDKVLGAEGTIEIELTGAA